MNKFRLVFIPFLLIVYIPHWIIYLTSSHKKEIAIDIATNCPRELRGIANVILLVFMLHYNPYFSELFAFRVRTNRGRYFLLKRHSRNFIIPRDTQIGIGFRYDHPYSTILNAKQIGDYFRVKNNVTIGNKNDDESCRPVIGNHVTVGVGAIIIGNISIGDHVIIGAGSVVVKDVPSNSVYAGNPARAIKKSNYE